MTRNGSGGRMYDKLEIAGDAMLQSRKIGISSHEPNTQKAGAKERMHNKHYLTLEENAFVERATFCRLPHKDAVRIATNNV